MVSVQILWRTIVRLSCYRIFIVNDSREISLKFDASPARQRLVKDRKVETAVHEYSMDRRLRNAGITWSGDYTISYVTALCANGLDAGKRGCKVDAGVGVTFRVLREIPEVTWTFPIYGAS